MGSSYADGRSAALPPGQPRCILRRAFLCALFASATASLLDSGATHSVHPSDLGAIDGTWRPDVRGLTLGDKSFLPVYGSVEKLFIHPLGGEDIRRRVLIAPGVCGLVWSASAEVDTYLSTITDAPGTSTSSVTLTDGRKLPIVKAANGLRSVDLPIRLSSASCAAMVSAGISHALSAKRDGWNGGSTTAATCLSMQPDRITIGVGKPSVSLSAIEILRLWHCRLGHPHMRSLVAILRTAGIVDACKITRQDIHAFALETCDFCNAFKQHRKCEQRVQWADHVTVSRPDRTLRPLTRVLLDVFGPVRWPSAQFGYIYLIGWWCQSTGMRWVQGSKSHTEAVIEGWNQRLRASLRFSVGEIEIIRTDGASEFGRSLEWPKYLAECLIAREQSVPYTASQMNGVERGWGIHTPDARCLLACGGTLGKRHWYTATRHAFFLGNVKPGRPERQIDGTITKKSAFQRAHGVPYPLHKLRTYSAPVRYVLDESQRDSKFDETARAAYYVGVSPDNASAHYVWDGGAHVTVGGSCIIDESRFVQKLTARAERIDTWDNDGRDCDPEITPTPAAAAQRLPPAHPSSAVTSGVIHAPVPNGQRISMRWSVNAAGDAWDWFHGTITDSRVVSSGRRHHRIEWDGDWPPDERWNWIDLLSAKILWKFISSAPNAPITQTPTTTAAAPSSTSAVASPASAAAANPVEPAASAAGAANPSRPRSAPSPAAIRRSRATTQPTAPGPVRNLRSRAQLTALLFAAAMSTATPVADTAAAALSSTGNESSRAANLYHLAADIMDDIDGVMGPPDSEISEAGSEAARVAVLADANNDFIAFDDHVRDALQSSTDIYLFSFVTSDHPMLAAAKGGGAKIDRKTVIFYTPDGVAKAIEPKSVRDALKSLQSDQWIQAIAVEIDNMRSHSAFHLVPRSEPLSKGKRILRLTFVFKIKVNADRTLDKYKARLCVVGTGQVQGQDYWESYSSTARTTSVKLIMVLTAVEDWIDFHFDVHGAFLTAGIDADVYTEQPTGQQPELGPNGEQMVWKLDKAIYGTVQAARLFRVKFRTFLKRIGFEESIDDDNVYRLDHKLGRIVLATHVDDGVGGASTQAVADWLYAQIEDAGFKFSVPPGPWKSVLGFAVHRNREDRSVTITAEKHIMDLTAEHLDGETVTVAPETPSEESIMKLEPPPIDETTEQAALLEPMRKMARSLVGALVYIEQVHPGISHAVARCCSLMAKPTIQMYVAAKRILAWLAAHAKLGVTFGGRGIRGASDLLPRGHARQPMQPQRDASLACTTDADLSRKLLPQSSDPAPKPQPDGSASRSQLGYEISIAYGCLHGSSRRQQSVAVDTPASELQAASVAAAHVLHIAGVLRFVSFGVLGHEVVPVWCDNEVSVLVSKDASPLKRLAYVARRARFLQELDACGIVKLYNVPGVANPADAFTKHLGRKEFQEYMRVLYNCDAECLRAGRRSRL